MQMLEAKARLSTWYSCIEYMLKADLNIINLLVACFDSMTGIGALPAQLNEQKNKLFVGSS